VSLIDKYPYGRAPFALLAIAIASVGIRVATARRHEDRPDLVVATHTDAHYAEYLKAIPRFEREHHVKVQLQLVNWASLQSRLQNSILAGTEVPDLAELFEGSMGYFTRGPVEDFGVMDLTDRLSRDGLSERVVESRFSLWSARGRIYGLPHDVHPVMLAYRRDLVAQLGIDVSKLDTWEKFVEVGQRISRDFDGDGVIDHYMIDLRFDGAWGLDTLMLQRGGQFFDPQGNVAFATEDTAELIHWYILQTRGPHKIGYDCGWGQPVAKAMIDGLVLFQWTPDWRSWMFEDEVPSLKGKMGLIPLPAWKPGGRRTSVWGGTGLIIMKATKNPELAWELAKFLYFDTPELGRRFLGTNIVPVLKDAWNLPEFDRPNPYWSNEPIGRLYANLAPEAPAVYSSPVDAQARTKLDEAFTLSVEHYTKYGEAGLTEAIRANLAKVAADVRRYADRESRLREGTR
jgi:arabinosaccharide transport system substrate-binding protein